jgi:hypothetical protein
MIDGCHITSRSLESKTCGGICGGVLRDFRYRVKDFNPSNVQNNLGRIESIARLQYFEAGDEADTRNPVTRKRVFPPLRTGLYPTSSLSTSLSEMDLSACSFKFASRTVKGGRMTGLICTIILNVARKLEIRADRRRPIYGAIAG